MHSRPAETILPSRLPSALAALGGSLLLNNAAGRYAERMGELAHESPDLLFRILPVVDLRFLFVWGFAAFVALAVGASLREERGRAARIAWMYALLIACRSLFLILTPMRLPESALPLQGYFLYDRIGRFLTMRNDLFFSAHTSLPFLGYLAFRPRPVRLAFLGLSVSMAATVILCRLHYSIDVAAAYFITYALYRAVGDAGVCEPPRSGPPAEVSRRGKAEASRTPLLALGADEGRGPADHAL